MLDICNSLSKFYPKFAVSLRKLQLLVSPTFSKSRHRCFCGSVSEATQQQYASTALK